MTSIQKYPTSNLVKQWIVIIGIFVLVQIIFILIDGTSLEPNINDSNNLIPRTARAILESKLFTEWITPYSFSLFNMFTTLHVMTILIVAIKSIFFKK